MSQVPSVLSHRWLGDSKDIETTTFPKLPLPQQMEEEN